MHSPRFTLVLPAGDPDKDIGHDRLGYEVNLPFSKIVSDRWTLHFKAGGSIFPDVRDRDLWNYNLGAGAIFAVTKNFNLMLESVVNWEEAVDETKRIDRTVSALISPGARYAINLPNDTICCWGRRSHRPHLRFSRLGSFLLPIVRTSVCADIRSASQIIVNPKSVLPASYWKCSGGFVDDSRFEVCDPAAF